MDELVEKIRSNAWRQCHALPIDAHVEIAQRTNLIPSKDDIFVILTQSCDLLNGNLGTEPSVEIIRGKLIASPDGNVTHAKSVRKLHLPIEVNGATNYFEFAVRDRFEVPREILSRYSPDSSRQLPTLSERTIIDWLLLRYRRTAMPDAFQDRLSKVKKKLREKAAALRDVEMLLIGLSSWSELPLDQTYTVFLLAVVSDEIFKDPEKSARQLSALQAFEAALQSTDGIDVVNVEMRPKSKVTLEHLISLRQWQDFDFTSLKD